VKGTPLALVLVGHTVAVFVRRCLSRRGRHLARRDDLADAGAPRGAFAVARLEAAHARANASGSWRTLVAVARHTGAALGSDRSAGACETTDPPNAADPANAARTRVAAAAAASTVDARIAAAPTVPILATAAVVAAEADETEAKPHQTNSASHGPTILANR
jgi:hypothetical protein